MEFVTPKVFKIAEMKLLDDNVLAWMKHVGGESCLAYMDGSDNEKLIQLAAKRCYKSFAPGLNPNVTKVRKDSEEYMENILKSGHGSVLEHASVTLAFEDVSRVFTHEIVRHRAGVAISQESLRYVRLTDLKFWMPTVFSKFGAEKEQRAHDLVKKVIPVLESAQKELAEIFEIESMTDFNQKKELTSAFRRLAPIGLATGIVLTMNFRALRHILEMRATKHAEEEMRFIIPQVMKIMERDYGQVFKDFMNKGDNLNCDYCATYHKV